MTRKAVRNRHMRGKRYHYKNLTFLVASLCIAYALSGNETFHSYLLHLGNLGYVGAFISGILFVSTFTVAIASLILLVLLEGYSPWEIGLIAGAGAVIGDLIIFRIIKDDLKKEIVSLYNFVDHNNHLRKVFHSRYFSWTLPVIGAILIASPLPDEIGVSLMGLSKISTIRFVILSFVLNATGIFLILSASLFIKP